MRRNGIVYTKNIIVNVWDGIRMNKLPIQESFFYRSLLENDRSLYDYYSQLVNTTYPKLTDPVASYKEFYSLFESIRDDGWKETETITFSHLRGQGNVITDGQHRASILLYLDGDSKLKRTGRFAIPVNKNKGRI